MRIFDRDLRAAGIEKVDERGRTLDIHALRHTFGTHLSKAGVAPRMAQALMRHSDIDLTMNVYTDPTLLDGHGALDALPSMAVNGNPSTECERQPATGTDDVLLARTLAPMLAPTSVPGWRNSHSEAQMTADECQSIETPKNAKTPAKQGLNGVLRGLKQERTTRLELATSSLGS